MCSYFSAWVVRFLFIYKHDPFLRNKLYVWFLPLPRLCLLPIVSFVVQKISTFDAFLNVLSLILWVLIWILQANSQWLFLWVYSLFFRIVMTLVYFCVSSLFWVGFLYVLQNVTLVINLHINIQFLVSFIEVIILSPTILARVSWFYMYVLFLNLYYVLLVRLYALTILC